MSIKVMTLVWDVAFPNLPAKMVALKLADCAHDGGDSIFPSVKTVTKTTGCAPSTVRKWLAAMEHCGLLVVTERSAGGAHHDTTKRRFNMDLLRELSADEPSRQLVETTVERISEKTGKPYSVTVFQIVDKAEGGPQGGCGEPDPRETGDGDTPPSDGGVETVDPSVTRTPPLRGTEATPPCDGPNPSLTRQGTFPPTPQGAEGGGSGPDLLGDEKSMQPGIDGFASRWTEAAQTEIGLLFENPIAGHVASEFLAHVAGTHNPPQHADAVAYVRQLRNRLQPFQAEILRALAQRMIETRGRDLPATSQLVEQATGLQRAAESQAKRERIVGAYPNSTGHVIRQGALQWDSWIEHLEATGQGETVRQALGAGVITVTHKFPQPAAEVLAIGGSNP